MLGRGGGLTVVIRQQGQPQAHGRRPAAEGTVVQVRGQHHKKVQPRVLLQYLRPVRQGTAADGVNHGVPLLTIAGFHAVEMLLIPALL